MRHPFIQLKEVGMTFGIGEVEHTTQVLKEVNLQVNDRDFMVILGPSGSGKSTILNIMAGLEQPTSGKILVKGRNLSNYDPAGLSRYHRLRTGMVFQSFNLLKSLNCWENVALPMAADGVRFNIRKKRALTLMEQFGLDQYANRHPNELSGGEQQRLAIARALINNPSLFLIDEPTGNLDTKTASGVMEIFAQIHKERETTIVMVTHNPDHTSYGTRLVYLVDGQIIKQEDL